MAHTPGPWGFDDSKPGFVTARGGPDICEVFGESARADECDFNHALIAAAPDLMAALHDIITCAHISTPYGGKAYCISDGRMDAAKAAIAKAEGRTDEE